MKIKKRLLIAASGITAVTAAGAMVAGVTFGFFSANTSATPDSNTFSSGTVSLTADASGACTVTNAVPGDSGSCTFVATYTGNVSAFVALDTLTSGALAAPGGLTFTVTDGNTTAYASTGTDLYVGTETGPTAANTFTINWSIPTTAGNAFQNTTATLTLMAHAVQSANNGACSTLGIASCVGTAWS